MGTLEFGNCDQGQNYTVAPFCWNIDFLDPVFFDDITDLIADAAPKRSVRSTLPYFLWSDLAPVDICLDCVFVPFL